MIQYVMGRKRHDLFYHADKGVVCAFQDRLGFAYHNFTRLLKVGTITQVQVGRCDGTEQSVLSMRVLRRVPLAEIIKILALYNKRPERGYWFEVLAD